MENIKYLEDLVKRIKASMEKIEAADTFADITAQERLTHPLLKEVQMVAPRVWNDFVQQCSSKRNKLSKGE